MHLLDLKPTRKILLLFILLSSFFQIQAQNLSIQFSPLDAVCNYDSINCAASVNYPFSIISSNEENLSLTYQIILEGQTPEDDINGEIMGTFPNFNIDGTYPLGNHAFLLNADDGVETITDTLFFSVVNCLLPVVECINGQIITLGDPPQPDGCCATAIWASNFVISTPTPCTSTLTYSIHITQNVINGSDIPSSDQIGVLVDCTFHRIVSLRVYAWDNSFNPYITQPDGTLGGANYSYCEFDIELQDNLLAGDACRYAKPMGKVYTQSLKGIIDTEVSITGGIDTLVSISKSTGYYYDLDDLWEWGFTSATFVPYKNTNPLNGVTTLDIIKITKHILGIHPLDSPYKLIAADVNNSENISAADIIQLRRLILAIDDNFLNNTSWRFIDADYVFPNQTNPWSEQFPETIEVSSPEYVGDYNFIGIKIGDVNGSAIPNE